jgi:hypothetical protein
MSSNDSVPGMIYPQQKPMLAGNPKDSAIAANNQSINRQADLIKATSGGRRHRRHKKYGGATENSVTVPQMQVQYSTTGAGGQDPNSIIKQNTSVSVQAAENAKYDNLARKGGSRKKRGGNPDWSWGCYSGGRKSRSRRSKSYKRKQNKKRRTRRNK